MVVSTMVMFMMKMKREMVDDGDEEVVEGEQ